MVVDSSAILAILFNEPERDAFAAALAEAGVRLMSSVNALETAVVVSARKGPHGARELAKKLPARDTSSTTSGSSPRSTMFPRSSPKSSTLAVRRLQPCGQESRNSVSGQPGTLHS